MAGPRRKLPAGVAVSPSQSETETGGVEGNTRTIRLSAYGLHPDCMRAAYELRMIAYKQMPLGYKYGDRSK